MYSEEKIIKACRKKDPFFQRLVYEKYFSKMLGICLRYSRDKDEAADLLHDSFIKVFEKFRKYRGEGSLEAWIARIVRNTAIDHSRKHMNKQTDYNENIAYKEDNDADHTEDLNELSVDEVISLFQWLPAGYRTVLNMYAIEEMSHKEIAKNLGISVNTSKTQLFKARKMLRTLVEQKQLEVKNER